MLFTDQVVLAGTAPAGAAGSTFFCTYRVTESDPGLQPQRSVTYGLRLIVGSRRDRLSLASPVKQSLVVGTFYDQEFPAASGGVAPYTYAFTCAGGSLPPGTGFAAGTRRFAGTPTTRFRDSCTYTVTDSAQPAETVSRAVEIEVTGGATPLVLASPADQSLVVGTFHDQEFPAASGGVAPYTYAFTCAGGSLPPGTGFAARTRRFAGTPTNRFRDSCAYTVTDSARPAETVSRAVEIEVTGGATPLVLASPVKQSLVVGTFYDQEFPAASGGVAPYTYAFTCAGGSLPPGTGFAAGTRRFAGTPTTRFRDSCTYTVTDSAQPAETVSRAVEIEVTGGATPLVLASPVKQSLVVGTFHDQELPAASGGVAPYTYAFTCAGGSLPPGTGFAAGTRRFAGTPTTRFRDSCAYTVTDSARPAETVSRAVEIEVTGGATPLVLASPVKQSLVVGTFHDQEFPAASGGVAPYTYAFTCAGGSLPPGTGFAAGTRRFAGTPTTRFRDSCTYTVTDSAQPAETVSRAVEIEVTGGATPLVLASPADQSLVVGTFHDQEFPAASGGVAPYTYAFTCAGGSLPPGTGFAARTRRFAGTPTNRFRDSCAYTVTDSARPAETVSRAVEIEVTGGATPLLLAAPDNQSLVVGTFFTDEFPEASGGVAPYTYAFTCAGGSLPPGTGFAAGTRRFAGTPTNRFHDSCAYTVTDSARTAETVSQPVEVEVTGGAAPLELTQVFEMAPGNELTLKIGRRSQTTFQMASGGVAPYTYELDCPLPAGLEFHPSTRVLSGTPNAEYRGPNCAYQVTDSSSPPASVSLSFVFFVEPLEADDWRFRTRTVAPGQGLCALPGSMPGGAGEIELATLPAAHGGAGGAGYALPGAPHPSGTGSILSFDPSTRVLTYSNPMAPPVLGTPNTYRYLVGTGGSVNATNADDALCLDFRVDAGATDDICPRVTDILISLEVRDDAFWDGNANEYRCPDTAAPPPRPGDQGSLSNPVHEALGPVHARRAAAVAHAAIRARVRGWSAGAEQAILAITPEIGLSSLSGQSGGFDYSGTSESASFGAETGAGAWQAGLIASVTNTELHYRAEAVLAEQGYRAGEHDTEILSLHPFAAWHAPSGGHFWASVGAGAGSLSHRDDLGFRSWSHSDVHLFAYAVGASVPLADVLSGEIAADAGIESFALDIEGGGRISSSLSTLQGRDWRAGLTWSAPLSAAPSVSMAYRHLTGDGPEGGRLETRGSVAIVDIFDPRLSLTGSAEASLGVGSYEQNSWGLGGGVRFAPNGRSRGFGLDLDTRLVSPAGDGSADLRLRGEAGYGLPSGPLLGTVRPYVKMIRYSSDQSIQRILGLELRETPKSHLMVEAQSHSRDRSNAIVFSVRHRF